MNALFVLSWLRSPSMILLSFRLLHHADFQSSLLWCFGLLLNLGDLWSSILCCCGHLLHRGDLQSPLLCCCYLLLHLRDLQARGLGAGLERLGQIGDPGQS